MEWIFKLCFKYLCAMICPFVCVAYELMSRCMCSHVWTCWSKKKTLRFFSIVLYIILFRQCLSLNVNLTALGRLGIQWAPMVHMSQWNFNHAWLCLICVSMLWILFQILTLVQKVFLPIEPCSNPCAYYTFY